MGTTPEWPRFLKEVRVKKRTWKRGNFEVGVEKVHTCARRQRIMGIGSTKCILRPTEEPLDERVWLAVEKEMLDALALRRRLREKTSVRRLDAVMMTPPEEEDDEKKKKKKKKARDRIMKVVEEESRRIIHDDPELAGEELKIVAKLKKMAGG